MIELGIGVEVQEIDDLKLSYVIGPRSSLIQSPGRKAAKPPPHSGFHHHPDLGFVPAAGECRGAVENLADAATSAAAI